MLKKYVLVAAAIFVMSGAVVPVKDARAAGLVPCGQTENDESTTRNETDVCTLCHLIIGVNDLITWGRNVMTIIAIVVITAMGILYIVSLGNPALMETAKKGIFGALIGVGLMLGAWLIVNVTLTVLAVKKASFGSLLTSPNTFSYQCVPRSKANSISGGGGTGTPPPPPTSTAVCPGVNVDTLKAALLSGSKVCGSAACPRTCDFTRVIAGKPLLQWINETKTNLSFSIDTKIIEAIICRENAALNVSAVNMATKDCGLMQVNWAQFGNTSCTGPNVDLLDLSTNLKNGITLAQQKYNRVTPTVQQISLGITKNAMTGAAYNCCANGDDPNASSNDCSTGWPTGMTKWACPVNPGPGPFNMCFVNSYACEIEACVSRY